MTLGDWITLGILLAGTYAVGWHAWRWLDRRLLLGARARVLVAAFLMSRRAVVPAPAPKPSGPDTDQQNRPAGPVVPAGSEPLANRAERVRLLASWREADGTYSHSANKIVAFVGGQRDEVLALIREVRGELAEPYDPEKHLRIRDAAGERVIAR